MAPPDMTPVDIYGREHTCSSCRYFEPDGHGHGQGWCHLGGTQSLLPGANDPDDAGSWRWPKMWPMDWCSEHQEDPALVVRFDERGRRLLYRREEQT